MVPHRFKEQLLLSEKQRQSHMPWQTAQLKEQFPPQEVEVSPSLKKMIQGIHSPRWLRGSKAFEVNHIKGVSSLDRGGEGQVCWHHQAATWGPCQLIDRDVSHQRLGHLDLFQNLGPSVFQAVAERSGFREKK